MTRVSKKEIGKIYKALEHFFREKDNEFQRTICCFSVAEALLTDFSGANQQALGPTNSTSAAELCVRYCNQLGLGAQIVKVSQAIAEKMGSVDGLAGRSPLSAAAACIYFASHLMKEARSAKEIAGVVGVSDGTIRTSYKFLEAKKDALIDPAWLKDGKGDIESLPKP